MDSKDKEQGIIAEERQTEKGVFGRKKGFPAVTS